MANDEHGWFWRLYERLYEKFVGGPVRRAERSEQDALIEAARRQKKTGKKP